MMAYAHNPSTCKTEAGRKVMSSRLAWLCSKTPIRQKKKKKTEGEKMIGKEIGIKS